MAVPRVYRRTGEPIVASYDFQEIAQDTGVIRYRLFATQNSSAVAYKAGISDVYSQPKGTKGTATTSLSYVKTNTFNFDAVTFKKPLTLRGDVVINVTHGTQGQAGVGSNTYLIIHVSKVDAAGTETSLGNVTSLEADPVDGAGATNEFRTSCLTISPTETNFIIGDKIRFRVEMYTKSASGGAASGVIAHDPQNRDISAAELDITSGTAGITAATNPTKFDVYVPYKVQQ